MIPTNSLVERISRLAKSCPELAHTFRFVAGAVWALASARKLGHRNRASYDDADRQRHLDELDEVLRAVRNGVVPPQRWEAGVYYHAAIMRIDACYERLLKAVLKAAGSKRLKPRRQQSGQKQSKTEKMAVEIENGLQTGSLKRGHLESIRKEVNKLKHELFGQGIADARQRPDKDDVRNAVDALSELLDILENQKILSCVNSKYSSLPPP